MSTCVRCVCVCVCVCVFYFKVNTVCLKIIKWQFKSQKISASGSK